MFSYKSMNSNEINGYFLSYDRQKDGHGLPYMHLLYTIMSKSTQFITRFYFCGEGPRSRRYGRTAALRLKMKRKMISFFIFPSNGAPLE
jgi:hypothetical protein